MIYLIKEAGPIETISKSNEEISATYKFDNSNNTPEKQKFDKLCEEKDYDAADLLIDSVGCHVCRMYKTSKKSAIRYLHNKFKNYSYIFKIYGSKTFLFELTVIGNEYKYTTFGDESYTDDQYFSRIAQQEDSGYYTKEKAADFKKKLVLKYNELWKKQNVPSEQSPFIVNFKISVPELKNERSTWEGILLLKYDTETYEPKGKYGYKTIKNDNFDPSYIQNFVNDLNSQKISDNISKFKIIKNKYGSMYIYLVLKMPFAN